MRSLEALADPTRRRLVELVAERDRSAGELAQRFPISRPAVSRHLRVLRDAQLVAVRGDGQRRIYSIDPTGLAEVDAWLDRYRRFWTERLDRLEASFPPNPRTGP